MEIAIFNELSIFWTATMTRRIITALTNLIKINKTLRLAKVAKPCL